MAYAKSFRDLEIYKTARQLSLEIFGVTKTFPKEETYSLTDQVRRSARSIGAQVAEAWAKRRYERAFVSKLTDADGELQETIHWTETAHDCGYLTDAQSVQWISTCESMGRMIHSMISKSSQFCSKDFPAGSNRLSVTGDR